MIVIEYDQINSSSFLNEELVRICNKNLLLFAKKQ